MVVYVLREHFLIYPMWFMKILMFSSFTFPLNKTMKKKNNNINIQLNIICYYLVHIPHG